MGCHGSNQIRQTASGSKPAGWRQPSEGEEPKAARCNNAKSDVSRLKWLKLELALTLAEATGRRLGAIRQLTWDDINLVQSSICWRAETDKKGKEWVIPIPPALCEELRSFRIRMGGAFGGLVFPSHADRTKPVSRDALGHWLRDAEERAGVPKLDGSLWHAYRRSWATTRKHLPAVDVAAAGGWSGTATLLQCYQQADHDTLLKVMSSPRKITDQAQSGVN